MKRWSSQLFAILLLGFLAALSFWLQSTIDLPEGKRDGKLRHDPDTVVERFTVRRLNAEGLLQYRLTAPHMLHFPDDDSSLITEPRIIYFRPQAPDMTIRGKLAHVTENGETVFFRDDVVATRAATSDRPELVARMPDLTVKPDDGIAYTASPVEITQATSWMKGVGMHIDNNESTFALQSQVTGLLYRTKTQP